MRKIPPALREQMANDPYYKVCARKNSDCEGRVTWEHAWIYAGRQIDEMWNFIPLCVYHHLGDGLDKDKNQRISLQRATDEDLVKYPRKNWEQLKIWLKLK